MSPGLGRARLIPRATSACAPPRWASAGAHRGRQPCCAPWPTEETPDLASMARVAAQWRLPTSFPTGLPAAWLLVGESEHAARPA